MRNMDNHNGQFQGQSYGNVILIHQTATTTSSSSLNETPSLSNQQRQETAVGSALEQKAHNPQEAEAEILEDLKQPSKQISLASTIYAYFGNLIHGKKKNDRFRADSVSDTAKNHHQQQQTAWWKRRFKSLSPPTMLKRSKGQETKKNQRFMWCFRPVGAAAAAAAAAHGKKQNPLFWTTFEKKNQLELSKQFERIRTVNRTNDCFELQDKKISGGKAVVNVMLKEGIAFVLDPEWSEPMTFEITQLPKLTLYQRLRSRRDYKRWYKRQQQHVYHQSRPA